MAIAVILAIMTVKIYTGQVLNISPGFPATLICLGVLSWRSIARLLKLPEGFTDELTGQR